jgi:acyl-CoA reductase-like NAD-dependent aldehyde dehydrogenase
MLETSGSPARGIGFLLDGQWRCEGEAFDVLAPYDGQVVATTFRATPAHLNAAIEAAARAFETTRKLPSCERQRVLRVVAEGIAARREEITRTLALEAAKPIKAARAEVERAIFTFSVAAEESTRIYGEWLPLDLQAATVGRWGLVRRFPIGPIASITPFNFPLNLVAHKVAPCIAAGNTMVLKPATQTPLSALMLGEIACEAGLVPGALNMLPCSSSVAAPIVEDDRLKMVTFTGSPEVGWEIKRRAGRKKVCLELGGNAGVVIDRSADLEYAAKRVAIGGYSNSGQSCISVQRVFVCDQVYKLFLDKLVPLVEAKVVGDPADEDTDVGPMISLADAERAEAWIREAVAGGARIVTGGRRAGSLLWPTILTDTKPTMKVNRLEVFAPLITVERVSDARQGIRMVDDSRYGLQAGIFTGDLDTAFEAFQEIEVGGVIVNDVPTWRADEQPYGGVKESGLGREGVRYAIGEMTEIRILVINFNRA